MMKTFIQNTYKIQVSKIFTINKIDKIDDNIKDL